jgi:hypothetical protein
MSVRGADRIAPIHINRRPRCQARHPAGDDAVGRLYGRARADDGVHGITAESVGKILWYGNCMTCR